MKEAGKYYKYLVWHGRVDKVECIDHAYAWSGKIPCTGIRRCVFCGKPEEEK
jgi:hypothetical protein